MSEEVYFQLEVTLHIRLESDHPKPQAANCRPQTSDAREAGVITPRPAKEWQASGLPVKLMRARPVAPWQERRALVSSVLAPAAAGYVKDQVLLDDSAPFGAHRKLIDPIKVNEGPGTTRNLQFGVKL